MRKALVFSLAIFCIATPAFSDTGIAEGNITRFLLYQEHTGLLIQHTNLTDPESCGSGNYFILRKGHPHYTDIYALLLASHMANRKVGLTISGCVENYPSIKHVYADQD